MLYNPSGSVFMILCFICLRPLATALLAAVLERAFLGFYVW